MLTLDNQTGALGSVGHDVAGNKGVIMPAHTLLECPKSDCEKVQKSFLVGNVLPESINRRTFNPYAEHLIKIDWRLFIILTWDDEECIGRNYSAECKRRKDFLHLINDLCRFLGQGLRERN